MPPGRAVVSTEKAALAALQMGAPGAPATATMGTATVEGVSVPLAQVLGVLLS